MRPSFERCRISGLLLAPLLFPLFLSAQVITPVPGAGSPHYLGYATYTAPDNTEAKVVGTNANTSANAAGQVCALSDSIMTLLHPDGSAGYAVNVLDLLGLSTSGYLYPVPSVAPVSAIDGSGHCFTVVLEDPSASGVKRSFVVAIANSGTLAYTKDLGSTGPTIATAIGASDDGRVVVAGYTSASDLPVTDASTYRSGTNDGFFAVLDPAGNLLQLSYFGGTGEESVLAISVDNSHNLLITGQTTSSDFTIVGSSLAGTPPASSGVWFAVNLLATGGFQYGEYLPASVGNLTASALDRTGSTYLAASPLGSAGVTVTKLDLHGSPIFTSSFGVV